MTSKASSSCAKFQHKMKPEETEILKKFFGDSPPPPPSDSTPPPPPKPKAKRKKKQPMKKMEEQYSPPDRPMVYSIAPMPHHAYGFQAEPQLPPTATCPLPTIDTLCQRNYTAAIPYTEPNYPTPTAINYYYEPQQSQLQQHQLQPHEQSYFPQGSYQSLHASQMMSPPQETSTSSFGSYQSIPASQMMSPPQGPSTSSLGSYQSLSASQMMSPPQEPSASSFDNYQPLPASQMMSPPQEPSTSSFARYQSPPASEMMNAPPEPSTSGMVQYEWCQTSTWPGSSTTNTSSIGSRLPPLSLPPLDRSRMSSSLSPQLQSPPVPQVPSDPAQISTSTPLQTQQLAPSVSSPVPSEPLQIASPVVETSSEYLNPALDTPIANRIVPILDEPTAQSVNPELKKKSFAVLQPLREVKNLLDNPECYRILKPFIHLQYPEYLKAFRESGSSPLAFDFDDFVDSWKPKDPILFYSLSFEERWKIYEAEMNEILAELSAKQAKSKELTTAAAKEDVLQKQQDGLHRRQQISMIRAIVNRLEKDKEARDADGKPEEKKPYPGTMKDFPLLAKILAQRPPAGDDPAPTVALDDSSPLAKSRDLNKKTCKKYKSDLSAEKDTVPRNSPVKPGAPVNPPKKTKKRSQKGKLPITSVDVSSAPGSSSDPILIEDESPAVTSAQLQYLTALHNPYAKQQPTTSSSPAVSNLIPQYVIEDSYQPAVESNSNSYQTPKAKNYKKRKSANSDLRSLLENNTSKMRRVENVSYGLQAGDNKNISQPSGVEKNSYQTSAGTYQTLENNNYLFPSAERTSSSCQLPNAGNTSYQPPVVENNNIYHQLAAVSNSSTSYLPSTTTVPRGTPFTHPSGFYCGPITRTSSVDRIPMMNSPNYGASAPFYSTDGVDRTAHYSTGPAGDYGTLGHSKEAEPVVDNAQNPFFGVEQIWSVDHLLVWDKPTMPVISCDDLDFGC